MDKKRRKCTKENLKSREKKLSQIEEQMTHSTSHLNVGEKKAFLRALNENGLNILTDLPKLRQYLPNRTEVEIQGVINRYKRKCKLQAPQAKDDFLKEEDRCKDVQEQKSPLELWTELCNLIVPSAVKRVDFSLILADMFHKYAEECKNSSSKYANVYSQVYEMLAQMMEGRYPSSISAHACIVLLSLYENVVTAVQCQRSDDEGHFIQQLYAELREKSQQVSAEEANEQQDEQNNLQLLAYFENLDEATLKQKIEKARQWMKIRDCPESLEKAEEGVRLMEQFENNPIHFYSLLPKIRKMVQTLNPLKLPVYLLQKQQLSLVEQELLEKNDSTT